jgi:hypothetical protein
MTSPANEKEPIELPAEVLLSRFLLPIAMGFAETNANPGTPSEEGRLPATPHTIVSSELFFKQQHLM